MPYKRMDAMSRQQITDMQRAYRAEKGISLPAVDKAATILRTLRFIVLFFFPFILLAGCSGGGKAEFPFPAVEHFNGGENGDAAVSGTGLDHRDYAKSGHRSPNYDWHQSFSHLHFWRDTVHLGGDLEPRENLRLIFEPRHNGGGFTISMGASRDGVGVDRLDNYRNDLETKNGTVSSYLSDDGFHSFRVQPSIRFGRGFENSDSELYWVLVESVRLLNDALPPEFQIKWGDDFLSGSLVYEGDIVVAARPPSVVRNVCSENAVACAISNISVGGHTRDATLFFPDDFDASDLVFARTVVVHELLHALGIQGHVDSIEFPDSIMGASGDFFPNPGFVMGRIDREVLQILYMSKDTARYNDWSEWSDTTLHLVGRSEDDFVHFGVALFNGLPQPWARGRYPDTSLAGNRLLTGRASWEGSLLGFSGPSPIMGDVRLDVTMSRLSGLQDLRFRDIFFLNRYDSDGPDRWFPARNLNYRVAITEGGNSFSHWDDAESDEGIISGVFLGPRHEGMAGTIKRTDLVGAFGGTR